MRVVTLGTGTISLTPGRVCAGHLVEAGSVRLLLDCGSGVTHRLSAHGIDWMGITHVAITHFHTDHHGDLPTLVFAWKYGRIPGRSAPLTVIGPAGIRALLERLAAAHGDWLSTPGFPLQVYEIAPDERLALGDGVVLAARTVPHTEESVAYSVERGGRRVVYSGDTGFDITLGDWAIGCDLLVCECSLPAAMAIPTHLTPEQCAELAGRAQPGHLALTHLYPPVEDVDLAAVMAAHYDGPVTVAHDGWHIEIEEH
jgi:ribonuclease BN (tRNA processing enzyme)